MKLVELFELMSPSTKIVVNDFFGGTIFKGMIYDFYKYQRDWLNERIFTIELNEKNLCVEINCDLLCSKVVIE